jgi:hypothetical protein
MHAASAAIAEQKQRNRKRGSNIKIVSVLKEAMAAELVPDPTSMLDVERSVKASAFKRIHHGFCNLGARGVCRSHLGWHVVEGGN